MRPALFASPWWRRVPLAAALALALGWLPYQIYGQSGLSRVMRLRHELAALHEGNRELLRKRRELRVELGLYDDDDAAAVERIARGELGMVKRGEIVFRVEEPR